MHVSELMHRQVVVCPARASALQVAELMWKFDVGCVPVVDEAGQVVGIVTDRDLAMGAFLQGAALRSIAVSTVMSKEVVCCLESATLLEAEQLMTARQVRRIPVVRSNGTLAGIVTLNDLARAATAGAIEATRIVRMLASISHPRRQLPAQQDD